MKTGKFKKGDYVIFDPNKECPDTKYVWYGARGRVERIGKSFYYIRWILPNFESINGLNLPKEEYESDNGKFSVVDGFPIDDEKYLHSNLSEVRKEKIDKFIF